MSGPKLVRNDRKMKSGADGYAKGNVTDGHNCLKHNEDTRNYRKEVLGIESAIPKIC